MNFQYMKLKNGKFHSYGYCVVPSYEAYLAFVDRLNQNKERGRISFVTC